MSKTDKVEKDCTDIEGCCEGNEGEQEVIYTNDAYRVEKIQLQTGVEQYQYLYGVYSNTYGVLEIETPILAKALNSADELEAAVNAFFQSKSFGTTSDAKVIETA